MAPGTSSNPDDEHADDEYADHDAEDREQPSAPAAIPDDEPEDDVLTAAGDPLRRRRPVTAGQHSTSRARTVGRGA